MIVKIDDHSHPCTRTAFLSPFDSPILDSRHYEIPFPPTLELASALIIRLHRSFHTCSSTSTCPPSFLCPLSSFLVISRSFPQPAVIRSTFFSKRILSGFLDCTQRLIFLSPLHLVTPLLPHQYCNPVFYCFYNLLLYSYLMSLISP